MNNNSETETIVNNAIESNVDDVKVSSKVLATSTGSAKRSPAAAFRSSAIDSTTEMSERKAQNLLGSGEKKLSEVAPSSSEGSSSGGVSSNRSSKKRKLSDF